MVLEFRYTDNDVLYPNDIYLHKIHPNLAIKLSKRDIWAPNDHVSLIGEDVFKINTFGRRYGLDTDDMLNSGLNRKMNPERLNNIKDIEIDTCIAWGPVSDIPITWNYTGEVPLEKVIWIDLENYKRYRKIVSNTKFDPRNNRDHIIIEAMDKIVISIERNILIDEIIK
jgi:hypothetical protein